ncbi:uridine diphosphate-N-acetylglucosamine-binding protein YvcK [Rhodococcus aerolatus]
MSAPAGPALVALGGGHGLHATLRAARTLTDDVTAVVTVADDGGSSGRLRRELDALPPGDLRMALAALADDHGPAASWSQVLQHRFAGSGALAGHPVGNLLLAGFAEVLGDPVAALDAVGRVLGVRGRVLPMSCAALDIEADVVGLADDPRVSSKIRGQVAVATTPGQVRRVRLLPEEPPACPEAVAAVGRADAVLLGPGSWFSSVIPHLLVPGLRDALQTCRGRRVVVANLGPEAGETAGFTTERHLHVLSQHAPDLRVDTVVLDPGAVPAGRDREHLDRAAAALGARVHVAPVAGAGGVHDPALLAAALGSVLGGDDHGAAAPAPGGGGTAGRRHEHEEAGRWR